MQTVNLQCGNCGNRITVEETALGLPVLCPHCQQAVPTPAALAAEPPSRESIFGSTAPAPDALFGSAVLPKLEQPEPILLPSGELACSLDALLAGPSATWMAFEPPAPSAAILDTGVAMPPAAALAAVDD